METFENIQNKDGFYITENLADTVPQTAANYGIIFIALRPCEILEVGEVHGTAGTDASAVTLQIEKLTGTTAKGSGTAILSAEFNLKGTANTVQRTVKFVSGARQLRQGDRLALKSTGTLTALKDVQVTIYLKPLGKGDYR